MLIGSFFAWWYGPGWALVFKNMQRRLQRTEQAFSVGSLLQTLFSPWRRVISYPGSSLQAHLQAMLDNTVSRFVGFTVRLFVLIAAAVILVGVLVAALVELIAWPLVPPAIVIGIIKGLLP